MVGSGAKCGRKLSASTPVISTLLRPRAASEKSPLAPVMSEELRGSPTLVNVVVGGYPEGGVVTGVTEVPKLELALGLEPNVSVPEALTLPSPPRLQAHVVAFA